LSCIRQLEETPRKDREIRLKEDHIKSYGVMYQPMYVMRDLYVFV